MDHFRIDDVDKFDKMFALIDADKPVEVYKNLHKDCWSVRQGGHAPGLGGGQCGYLEEAAEPKRARFVL